MLGYYDNTLKRRAYCAYLLLLEIKTTQMSDFLDIELLSRECSEGHIKWTAHILEKMQERYIEPSDVIYCISNGKIIEHYPQAYPYPACLILGITISGRHIHTVTGYGSGFIWIITVYEPDESEWIEGFSVRREQDR